jgi:uncharacterized glyoxalase superfamily protein PhnB
MKPAAACITIVSDRLKETRAFYETHFAARASFDCGWYVVLNLGGTADGPELCLKEPREGEQPYAGGTVLNLTFDDVDAVYAAIAARGVTPVMPLEDHPWGDRGFAVADPSGQVVYCLTPIEPSPEFSQYRIALSRSPAATAGS